jgi:tetratricopeptide (TPR) repeat protein
MLSGKQTQPYISQEAVRTALELMRYSAVDKNNTLLHLLMIDEFLINPDFPPSVHDREFALNAILIDVISSEYARLKSVFFGQTQIDNRSREEAIAAIQAEAGQESQELICWSWLYHHYVRVDLHITAQTFCKQAYIDDRTLRRYRQHALKRLTDKLIQLEWSIRINRRKRRLHLELPNAGKLDLIGRHEEKLQVIDTLKNMLPPHVQIVGAAGIGKTALAEEALKTCIDDEAVEQLIWINRPKDIKYVHTYLVERLLPANSPVSLREYLLLKSTAIVIDDLPLEQDSEAVTNLMSLLSPAMVIVTTRAPIPLPNLTTLVLDELSPKEAVRLIDHLLTHHTASFPGPDHNALVDDVWRRGGGNPLLIQLIVSNTVLFYDNPLHVTDIYSLFASLFMEFAEDIKRTWVLFALLPPDTYKASDLIRTWQDLAQVSHLRVLVKHHIVEVVPDNNFESEYRLINSARYYIESLFPSDPHVSQMIVEILTGLNLVEHVDGLALCCVEYTLSSDWSDILPEEKWQCVRRWSSSGIHYGHWATWKMLLERAISEATEFDADLHINYSICLRNLGEWQKAQAVLEHANVVCGRHGRFGDQARILLESSVILRYQGKYEFALSVARQALQVAARLQHSEILATAALEQCQIALDTGNVTALEKIIPLLPQTISGQLILSEVYLQSGQIEKSQTVAHSLLEHAPGLPLQARIYTIIGQGYAQRNNIVEAQKYFTLAITTLEQTDDIFALARAKCNLGGYLISTENYSEAYDLLSDAWSVQERLNDVVGLAITKHNLTLLNLSNLS